jgi:hypothetical protein
MGCAAAGRGAPGGGEEAAARAVLGGFVRDVEAGRWPEAWRRLSARWRAAATPGQLATDFAGAGPVARDAVARVVALLAADAPLVRDAEGFRLPAGPGRAARLVREGSGFRVDAIE